MNQSDALYRKAFEEYMRKGTPIELSLKQSRPTTHYIWRARKDRRVRSTHRANDGKIFAWDDPPPTGHPGEEFGCRCYAEPYQPEVVEFFDVRFTDVCDTGRKWMTRDYVEHYFFGNGKRVSLRQTGNLRVVVAKYGSLVLDDPLVLRGQIADEARETNDGSFSYPFDNTYPMRDVVYSLGRTVIRGEFSGTRKSTRDSLTITGKIKFQLRDKFEDPLDIGEGAALFNKITGQIFDEIAKLPERIDDLTEAARKIANKISSEIGATSRELREFIFKQVLDGLKRSKCKEFDLQYKNFTEIPGGTPYDIFDDWGATVSARINLDRNKSQYNDRSRP